jgi:hypothetical protein
MDSSVAVFQRFIERLTGPMHVRFIVQPVMAIILGIRDGLRDAREGRTPFLQDLCTRPEGRAGKLKETLVRLLIPLIVAIMLDAVVQYMLFERVRVLGAIVVGTLIMGLPYSIARGITNRIASARLHSPFQTRPSRG